MSSFLFWTSRLLGVLYLIFISLFALDMFGEGFSWLGLFMHLIPSILVLIAIIVSWKRDLLGAIGFLVIGAGWLAIGAYETWVSFSTIVLPLLVISGLYFWRLGLKHV